MAKIKIELDLTQLEKEFIYDEGEDGFISDSEDLDSELGRAIIIEAIMSKIKFKVSLVD